MKHKSRPGCYSIFQCLPSDMCLSLCGKMWKVAETKPQITQQPKGKKKNSIIQTENMLLFKWCYCRFTVCHRTLWTDIWCFYFTYNTIKPVIPNLFGLWALTRKQCRGRALCSRYLWVVSQRDSSSLNLLDGLIVWGPNRQDDFKWDQLAVWMRVSWLRICRADEGCGNRCVDGWGGQVTRKGVKVQGHLVDSLRTAGLESWGKEHGLWDRTLAGRWRREFLAEEMDWGANCDVTRILGFLV